MSRRNDSSQSRKTIVAVLAITASFVLLAVCLATITGAADHDPVVEQAQLVSAPQVHPAEDLVDDLVYELWGSWIETNGGEAGSLQQFRDRLDADGIARGAAVDVPAHVATQLGLAASDRGIPLDRVTISREDALTSTTLEVRATLADGREITSNFRVHGQRFEGLNFALLAKNVNCVMCHAHIDNAARVYNRDPMQQGSFKRVRVGALEHFQLRPGLAQSHIAGTLYTRGTVFDALGQPLDIEKTTLTSAEFDRDLFLLEDTFGALLSEPFSRHENEPGGNLYVRYPRPRKEQVDGILPDVFPAVIPDVNMNRRVDDNEFIAATTRATGRLAGGFKRFVAKGES